MMSTRHMIQVAAIALLAVAVASRIPQVKALVLP